MEPDDTGIVAYKLTLVPTKWNQPFLVTVLVVFLTFYLKNLFCIGLRNKEPLRGGSDIV